MIAIALDVYDRVTSENRETVVLKKKAALMADYVWDDFHLPYIKCCMKDARRDKFIYALKPKKPDSEADE